jgi:hypothetical protein
MSSVSFSGANARLSYQQGGTHIAEMRCRHLADAYGVVAEESHARSKRAFYPHRRVPGSFMMALEFKGWREFNRGMGWFRDYTSALLGWNDPSPMTVRLDARSFLRLAVPTTGIQYGDHTGSMLFSPTITFVSVMDPRDPGTGIVKKNDVSQADLPNGQVSSQWFYPDSQLERPGALQQYLYDQSRDTTSSARALYVQNMVTGGRAYF